MVYSRFVSTGSLNMKRNFMLWNIHLYSYNAYTYPFQEVFIEYLPDDQ